MWPGDRQPGGEQNPQQNGTPQGGPPPNPYQQPGGYGQPNPYQQPGYGPPSGGYGYPQGGFGPPNSGQGGGGSHWGGPPTVPGGPKGSGGGNTRAVIAIVVSVAVIAAAVITGVVLLRGGGEEPAPVGGPSTSPSPTASASRPPTPSPSPSETVEDGSTPVVAGWQTVVNPKHSTAFDIPETDDWEVASPTTYAGFQREEDGVQEVMSAPAYFHDGWCGDASAALVGTKGAQGSKSSQEAVEIAVGNWAILGYDHDQKGELKVSDPKAFSNDQGVKGHTATATITDVPKKDKCTTDGKVTAVSWVNGKGDLVLWIFITDTGTKYETSDAMIAKIAGSIRNYDAPDDPRA